MKIVRLDSELGIVEAGEISKRQLWTVLFEDGTRRCIDKDLLEVVVDDWTEETDSEN